MIAAVRALAVAACLLGVAAPGWAGAPTTAPTRERREVPTPAGRVRFDWYPAHVSVAGPRPLVVVAHGFWRSRVQMAGWGAHFSGLGYATAVPDLPAWSDHARNGRALGALVASLLAHPPAGSGLDHGRVALVGFSAGGLAALLAAADAPHIRVWIGLDPVDRDGLGARAALRFKGTAVILQGEPSACNGQGNASGIAESLGGRVTVTRIAGATHVDAEWPTTRLARLACGGSDERRRQQFVAIASAALGDAFKEHR
jgi:dienelactone hydrolase